MKFKEISIFDLLAFTADPDGGAGGVEPQGGQKPTGGQEPQYTLEGVQKFLSENEDAKKWQSSQLDSHFTKSLKTWKENNLTKEVEKEIAKRFPAETDEQKKIREMELKIEQMEAENKKKDLFASATKKANEMGLPIDMVDFLIGQDEETTIANIDKIHNIFNDHINKSVDERFKQKGGNPAGTGGNNSGIKVTEYEKAKKAGDIKSMLRNKQIKK